MIEKWMNIEHFNELLKEIIDKKEGTLNFMAKFLIVSEIAEQYYCEKKVEMVRMYGGKETREMELGTEAHELLLKDSVRIKREKVLQEIASGRVCIVRHMLLLGKHSGIVVAGRPDAVVFRGSSPILLFEHKFSSIQFPFADHHVQAGLYCYLLHLMGWDTERLKYALVMAPPECKGDDQLMKIPSYVLREQESEKVLMKLPGGDVRIYVRNFDIKRTVDNLDWALGFWRRERSAKPTAKSAKCKSCEHKERCLSARVPTS